MNISKQILFITLFLLISISSFAVEFDSITCYGGIHNPDEDIVSVFTITKIEDELLKIEEHREWIFNGRERVGDFVTATEMKKKRARGNKIYYRNKEVEGLLLFRRGYDRKLNINFDTGLGQVNITRYFPMSSPRSYGYQLRECEID